MCIRDRYKKEAFEAFVDLMADMRRTLANRLFRAQIEQRPQALRAQRVTRLSGPSDTPPTGVGGGEAGSAGAGATRPAARPEMSPTGIAATAKETEPVGAVGTVTEPGGLGSEFEDVGRNDPCPCGSGKKFKKCHGAKV